MQSLNFEFLRKRWPQFAELGGFAEEHIYADPASSVSKMRTFVEKLVGGLYRELRLESPPQPRLVELLEGAEFRELVPRGVLLKLDAIRIHGNKASHGGAVSVPTAQGLLKELFDIAKWFYVVHVRGKLEDLPHFKLPPRPGQAKAESAASQQNNRAALLKLAAQEAQLEALLRQVEEANAARQIFEQEAAELRVQLKGRGQPIADELGFNEAKTRRWLIDTQLVAAGFNVGAEGANTNEVGQEVELSHQPTETGKGAADYVVWDDNGKPLAVIEAKRTAEDPAKGKTQARLYADGLEQMHGQRPVMIYTNGFDIWLWDDAQGYPPRKIYGFYSKDSLQQLIFQRNHRKPLNTLAPNKAIVDRLYQLNAVKRVTEKFEARRRKALIVQATGTGKTRVAIALAELLADANWAKRILFLCDRRELRKQAKNAFTQFTAHTPVIVRSATAKERGCRPIFPTSAAMKLHSSAPRELVVAILMIAAIPVFAHAQQPSAAIVTHADARKVLEIIKGDRAKTEAYCDMVHLGHEMAAADEKKADELNQKIGQLQRKLGPEYTALMDGFQDLDLGSEVGQEISSMFAALDGLCGG